MKKPPERPVLITDAARSQSDQLRSREIRYVSMMAVRAGCLIAGAILISVRPPLLSLWLILCAAGMVFLPWAAVLIANDRPPKSRAHPPAPRPEPSPRALEEPPDPAPRTIDLEP
ncbi:DUF3099 domain-containing protein [Actinoplanes sp. NPDC051475]|uniref:DUF3099 domain-containing protein n=1 Tax=Actinoplanes sp. NPDC051475 TaxID=3157225 RepID=UPI00344F661E